MTVLFVVATIIVFLAIDALVRRVREKRSELVPETVQEPRRGISVRMPDGIFFARSHTWLNLFPSGKVRLGVDDFVGRMLEHPGVVMLKKAGDPVKKGDPLFRLEEEGHSLTVRSPIDGDVTSANEDLRKHPVLLKQLLFSDGWAYTIKPASGVELRSLLLGDETRKWMKDEFARLRDVFAGVNGDGVLAPATLQDGGPPFSGSMKHMSDFTWKRFEDEFLKVE